MSRAGVAVPFALAVLVLSGCACGDDMPPTRDAGVTDARPGLDAAPVDAAPIDAAPLDAGPPDDASVPPDAPPSDAGPPVCRDDEECQSGTFCDGAERCAPGDPAADEHGCAPPTGPRCMETQICDEAGAACRTQCEIEPDADGDGHDDVACGGDDCDDADEEVHPGAPELCSGRDEDCDLAVDEGFDVGEVCDGAGECGAGTIECASLTAARCSTDPGGSEDGAVAETCNGLDDDCDGVADDGFGLGETCTALGECGAGVFECAPGGTARCSTEPGGSADGRSPERCDALDHDCDGDPLNGLAVGDACSGVGECGAGARECAPDGSVRCSTLPGGSADQSVSELCNGLDDDCDGGIDEGGPGGGGACDTGVPGVCAAGVEACIDGALACVQTATPSPEICDGIDNDCDGVIDDGNPGGGGACNTGVPGVCSAGAVACVDGALACVQTVAPSPELCNGLDDDCNGVPDDGNPGGGGFCHTGRPGVCTEGRTRCASGAITCDQVVPASPEVCDGLDNDCNGQIDQGNPGGGAACTTGIPGACAPGFTACLGGALQCQQTVGPTPEICDGIDNNCNGSTDEMPPTVCSMQHPGAIGVASWACASGACGVTGCQPGRADINRTPGDGCECVTDTHASTCGSAGSVSVPRGATVNVTGVVEQATGSDFVRVNFTVSAVGQSYAPRIHLSNNAGGQYGMEVLTSCTGPAACSGSITTWEQNYAGYTPGAGCCTDNTPRVGSVTVRVFRRFLDAPTCSPYTVTATNP